MLGWKTPVQEPVEEKSGDDPEEGFPEDGFSHVRMELLNGIEL